MLKPPLALLTGAKSWLKRWHAAFGSRVSTSHGPVRSSWVSDGNSTKPMRMGAESAGIGNLHTWFKDAQASGDGWSALPSGDPPVSPVTPTS